MTPESCTELRDAGRRVVVSGVACTSSFASSAPELIRKISAGEVVDYRPAIRDERILSATGLSFNPLHAGLPDAVMQEAAETLAHRSNGRSRKFSDPRTALLADVSLGVLEGRRTFVRGRLEVGFLECSGAPPEISRPSKTISPTPTRTTAWISGFSPSIRSLKCESFRQDTLSAEYAEYFQLADPVCTLFSACSSSLSALLLATRKISQGKLKRALVLCFQEVTLFDILFLAGLNILSRDVGLPFCKNTDSISLGYGIGGLLIEREDGAGDRGASPYFAVRHITGGRGFSGSVNSPGMSVPFRAISQSMEAVLSESGLVAADIDCIFPHGNGIRANDQAEEMAMDKLFGDSAPPISNYTYQTGYLLSASGVFDLIMATDLYRNNRLWPFVTREEIDANERLRFLQRAPAAKLAQAAVAGDATPGAAIDGAAEPLAIEAEHMLKTCIGIDGSIVNCVLERA